jgi:hypothetical protein
VAVQYDRGHRISVLQQPLEPDLCFRDDLEAVRREVRVGNGPRPEAEAGAWLDQRVLGILGLAGRCDVCQVATHIQWLIGQGRRHGERP